LGWTLIDGTEKTDDFPPITFGTMDIFSPHSGWMRWIFLKAGEIILSGSTENLQFSILHMEFA